MRLKLLVQLNFGVGQYPNTNCGTLHLLEMATAKPILLLLIANHAVMSRFQKVIVQEHLGTVYFGN